MLLFLLLLLLLLLLCSAPSLCNARSSSLFSFFLSLRGNALILSRTPLSCALIIPPSSHIPQLFTPSPLTPASQPAIYPSVESNDLDNLDDCPTNFYHTNRSRQQCWGYLSFCLSFSRDRDNKQTKQENDSTYGKSTRGILNAKAITSP